MTSRTFEIVVAGRRLDDGDVAIMMVEAGGTERTWELYEDGAPKITEELIAEGLEASKQWIGAAIDLQIALHAEYVLAHGPIDDDRVHAQHRLHARGVRGGVGARARSRPPRR